jgi:hypothetical protein
MEKLIEKCVWRKSSEREELTSKCHWECRGKGWREVENNLVGFL